MSDYNDELQLMDAAVDRAELGLALQTVGYLIAGFCSITCLWIFTGWRVGSWLWFWITVGLFFIGMGTAAAGSRIRGKAYEVIAGIGVSMQTRLLRVEKQPELPPRQDLGPKAA